MENKSRSLKPLKRFSPELYDELVIALTLAEEINVQSLERLHVQTEALRCVEKLSSLSRHLRALSHEIHDEIMREAKSSLSL